MVPTYIVKLAIPFVSRRFVSCDTYYGLAMITL